MTKKTNQLIKGKGNTAPRRQLTTQDIIDLFDNFIHDNILLDIGNQLGLVLRPNWHETFVAFIGGVRNLISLHNGYFAEMSESRAEGQAFLNQLRNNIIQLYNQNPDRFRQTFYILPPPPPPPPPTPPFDPKNPTIGGSIKKRRF